MLTFELTKPCKIPKGSEFWYQWNFAFFPTGTGLLSLRTVWWCQDYSDPACNPSYTDPSKYSELMDLSSRFFFRQVLQFKILIENIYESIIGLSKHYKWQSILLECSAIFKTWILFFSSVDRQKWKILKEHNPFCKLRKTCLQFCCT